jgi:putative transposase
MRKSRFNGEQIVAVLKEADAGVPIGELCRRLGRERGDVLSLEDEVWWAGKERSATVEGLGRRERSTEKDRRAASFGHRRTEGGALKKVVGPQARREAVRVACEEGKLSERRACGLVGIARGSVR